MIPPKEVKRIIFGWMVDFLCWNGLSEFLSTLNYDSILRTQDLLNGCLDTPVIMDNVPYRQKTANLVSFLLKICSGNNHKLNTNCKTTILETAVIQLQQLKMEIPEFADKVVELEMDLRIHAVIVCCTGGDFNLATDVYDRLELNSFPQSELINDKTKKLFKNVKHIVKYKDKNHELLTSYSYKSFIQLWLPLFKDIFCKIREPHLVEICRGMIGNKLIAIEADLDTDLDEVQSNEHSNSSIEIPRMEHEENTITLRHKEYCKKVDKTLRLLNVEKQFSDTLRKRKRKSLSKLNNADKQKLVGNIQKRLSKFVGVKSIIQKISDEHNLSVSCERDKKILPSFNLENDLTNSIKDSMLECRVLCVPLEDDTSLPSSLRNLSNNNESTEGIPLHSSFSECDEDLEENQHSHCDDNDVENAVALLHDEESPTVRRLRKSTISTRNKPLFGSTSSLESFSDINEKSNNSDEITPLRKVPKLDLTLGSILDKRTTLTPPRRSPVKIPEKKKKVSWTPEEEDKLYAGVRLFEEGNWERIRWQFALNHRSSIELHDKWRNLKKITNEWKIEELRKRYLKKLKPVKEVATTSETEERGNSPVY